VLRSLLFNIAKRIITDPRVQQKAASTNERDIRPVVKDATKRMKSNIEFAAEEIRETAKDSHPLTEPGDFIQKIRTKLLDPEGQLTQS
jgi:hypothetical protein